jgi:formate dehydrogenase major subunit
MRWRTPHRHRGPDHEAFVRKFCDSTPSSTGPSFVSEPRKFAGGEREALTACRPASIRSRPRASTRPRQGTRSTYGLLASPRQPGLDHCLWAWATSRWRPAISAARGRVNPLRGQNNVQARATGLVSRTSSRATARLGRRARALFEEAWGVTLDAEPGLRITNMLDARGQTGAFAGIYIQRGHRAVRSRHPAHRRPGLRADGLLVRRPGTCS